MFDFRIPSDPIWVRQVKIGTEEEINQFLLKVAKDKSIQNVNIMGVVSSDGKVLVTFDLNVNSGDE